MMICFVIAEAHQKTESLCSVLLAPIKNVNVKKSDSKKRSDANSSISEDAVFVSLDEKSGTLLSFRGFGGQKAI